MALIASFESDIIKTAHFFNLRNMFADTYIRLLFDTGATYSVIGINNILESLEEPTHNAIIGSVTPFDFYFELTEDHLEEPILGRSYSEDCMYSHGIQGKIRISGIADNPGYRLYAKTDVLDFNIVMDRYYARVSVDS